MKREKRRFLKYEGTEVEKDQIRYDKRSISSEVKERQFAQMRKDHTPATSEGGLVSKLNSKKSKVHLRLNWMIYLLTPTTWIRIKYGF